MNVIEWITLRIAGFLELKPTWYVTKFFDSFYGMGREELALR